MKFSQENQSNGGCSACGAGTTNGGSGLMATGGILGGPAAATRFTCDHFVTLCKAIAAND